MVCGFFGHRNIGIDIDDRLYDEIVKRINEGYDTFMMGDHGDFDKQSLKVCCQLKDKYNHIKIVVVTTAIRHQLTSVYKCQDEFGYPLYVKYETTSYPIEDEFYLNRIQKSNQHMVDDCDCIICYVNTFENFKSGARKAVHYAAKKGKPIINIFSPYDLYRYNKDEEEKENQKKLEEFLNSGKTTLFF